MLLFINGRPVECQVLKRALEATYAGTLPKASKPFVFLVRHLSTSTKPMAQHIASFRPSNQPLSPSSDHQQSPLPCVCVILEIWARKWYGMQALHA